MTKKVCVIGGSGFLGSHVADELSRQNYEVQIFDRAESHWLNKNQKMIRGDILNQKDLVAATEGCDIVYNFAALADLNEAKSDPIGTIEINILGNALLLEACRKNGVSRYVYASTVYVNSREGGFYRCSKHAAESYIEEYKKLYGLNYTILRYGSLYGPRSGINNGLYKVIKGAIQTGEIRYSGSRDALREYIHVEDAAIASVRALEEGFKNQSFVFTGQEAMRVLDVLEMIREILGIESEVIFESDQNPGHYTRTPYAYTTQVGKKYIPNLHVDLGQGLLNMIRYIKAENESK